MERIKKISATLAEHMKESCAVSGGHQIGIVMLHGSQNYGLDDEKSDIDTKAIELPLLDDFLRGYRTPNRQFKRKNGEYITLMDVRAYVGALFKTNINMLETLFTPYVVIDKDFAPFWTKLTAYKDDIAKYNLLGLMESCYYQIYDIHNKLQNSNSIQQFGKKAAHTIFLRDFMYEFIKTEDFWHSINHDDDFLRNCRRGGVSYKEAREIAAACEKTAYSFLISCRAELYDGPTEHDCDVAHEVTGLLYDYLQDYLIKMLPRHEH